MKEILIRVADKLPKVVSMAGTAVRDNRYRLTFEFDDEWQDGLKTYIIADSRGHFVPYPSEENHIDVELGGSHVINVGVMQDILATSRPCQIFLEESIRQKMKDEIPPPEPEAWTYITEQIRILAAAKLSPVQKAEDMTQEVGVDPDGRLWTNPGSGGIIQETDPTVSDWAKKKTKPSYTASEVGAFPEEAGLDLGNYVYRLFLATYDQTTFAEIRSAHRRERHVLLRHPDIGTMPMAACTVEGAEFFTVNEFGTIRIARVNINDDWYVRIIKPEMAENRENTLSNSATNYPSSYAVTQAIAALNTVSSLVFDTIEEMDQYIAEFGDRLKVGQSLYIRASDVPDYWWDGVSALPMESGGSGESDLIVTITENEDGTYTADHTYAEIETAINAKRRVRVFDESSLTGKPQEYPLYSAGINSLNGQFIGFSYISGSRINSYEYFASGEIRKIGSEIVPKYRGATEQYNGVYGYVPAATAGQQDYIFHGDGAWRKPAETISSASANTDIPTAKAVYDAIQAAIPDSGDNSGSSAGMVVFTALYIDGQATVVDSPAIYPDGANALDLLAAGQARMLMLTPPDSDTEMAKKLGVLDLCFVDLGVGMLQFVGTITGKDGNEAVTADFSLETNEITITPAVQNSAGSGGGGGVVTITANEDGTYSSSHTPAEIAAMAETGAVVAFLPMGDDYLFLPLVGRQGTTAIFMYTAPSGAGGGIDTMVVMVTNDGVALNQALTANPMLGADAYNDGAGGTVPAPHAGQQDYVLHGDGTWRAALSEDDKMELVTRVLEKLPAWEGGTY